jgi:1-deoxy-D-xylulose-5-phosphate synthase
LSILESIKCSADVKALSMDELNTLCGEIRSFLISSVSKTGGHLASNLGVVELTVAIHNVFDTDNDRLVFDVGHQCYVHKLLTGRMGAFDTLRQEGGLSGYPKPCESISDAFIAGHASNSISVALGMARARTLSGDKYNVVALAGDGALTGGLSFEGLNSAGQSGEPLIIILNDNGMAINGPWVGFPLYSPMKEPSLPITSLKSSTEKS